MQATQDPTTGVRNYACDDWDEFVTSTRTLTVTSHIFRGHAEPSWVLSSELERVMTAPSIPPPLRSLSLRDGLGAALVNDFRDRAVGYLGSESRLLDDLDWRALGRHNGLVTDLLDWTRSPFVAAFFAFVTKAESDISGFERGLWGMDNFTFPSFEPEDRVAVWALRPDPGTFIAGEFEIVSPLAYANTRQQAQRGVFTRLRHAEYTDVASYLHSRGRQSRLLCWTLPFSELDTALTDLHRMNITWGTLFPDLHGAAKQANGISAWGRNAPPDGTAPMGVYGVTGSGDVVEGSVIVAMIDGKSVGTSTANADGWIIEILSGSAGDLVSFTIDGEVAAQTVEYAGFATREVTLTRGAGASR